MEFTSYPKTICTFEHPTNASESGSDAVLVSFINKLQAFLSANVSAVNLSALWASTSPSNPTSDLDELVNITYPILILKEQINHVRAPFYADYAAVHDGRTPFIDPASLIRWVFGDSYPASALTDAITNKTLFMNWFQEIVVKSASEACSDSFVHLCWKHGGPE